MRIISATFLLLLSTQLFGMVRQSPRVAHALSRRALSRQSRPLEALALRSMHRGFATESKPKEGDTSALWHEQRRTNLLAEKHHIERKLQSENNQLTLLSGVGSFVSSLTTGMVALNFFDPSTPELIALTVGASLPVIAGTYAMGMQADRKAKEKIQPLQEELEQLD